MRALQFAFAVLAVAVVGCGQKNPPEARKSIDEFNKLTPEQQIEKIRNDPKIPDQYKEAYIRSQQAKLGQGGQ